MLASARHCMRANNKAVAAVLCLGTFFAYVSPLIITRSSSVPRLIDAEGKLPPQAAIRGAYTNSGSRDAGPDMAPRR